MLGRRGAEGTQAERDAEWRALVRTVTDPEAAASEHDETRFREYLEELGARPRRRRPRWMRRAAEENTDSVPVDSDHA